MVDGLLQDKTVILTGAGSNVGRIATGLFYTHGANLCLVDRDPSRIVVPHQGRERVMAIAADLTAADAAEDMVARTVERFGRIDGLANTFGIDPPTARGTLDTSDADWSRILDVNLKGVFYCCRAALGPMIEAGSGSIVNVASQGALAVLPGMTAYGVSKAGVLQLTRQIAADHGKDGVRANCVCPSGLEDPSADRLAILDDGQLARRTSVIASMSPLGRVCTPLDVANGMLFLLSDLAAFTTAAALPVEGGGTAVLRF